MFCLNDGDVFFFTKRKPTLGKVGLFSELAVSFVCLGSRSAWRINRQFWGFAGADGFRRFFPRGLAAFKKIECYPVLNVTVLQELVVSMAEADM